MSLRPWHLLFPRLLFPRRLFSPGGLLHLAALLALGFVLLHLAGLRAYASVLSGTSPTGGGIDQLDVLLCVLYVGWYFVAVLGVPILALGGLVDLLLTRLAGGSPSRRAQTSGGKAVPP
jgi:hypothetical protein